MTKSSAAKKTITVIGCGGFIGSHLLDRLLTATDYHVIGVDLAWEKIAHHKNNPRLTFINKNIHDIRAMEKCIKQSGSVIFLAALCNPSLYNTQPLAVIDASYSGTLPLIDICAETGARILYFSTSEVYGRTAASFTGDVDNDAKALLKEDESPFILGPTVSQRWCYAAAKQLMERTIYAYGRERGLRYTIIRPFNFIGPRMDFIPGVDGEGIPRVLACFIAALLSGDPMQLVDEGKNRRAFTWIGDAIDACMKILEKPDVAEGHIFNIGNPANEITIANLAARMISIWNSISPDVLPYAITPKNVSGLEFYGQGYEDSDRRLPDIGKARSILDWEPKTDLDSALRKTLEAALAKYKVTAGIK